MRNHSRWVQQSRLHHFQRLDHVVRIAATGTDDMRRRVMHVVEVKTGGELRIGRTGKEVQIADEFRYLPK